MLAYPPTTSSPPTGQVPFSRLASIANDLETGGGGGGGEADAAAARVKALEQRVKELEEQLSRHKFLFREV